MKHTDRRKFFRLLGLGFFLSACSKSEEPLKFINILKPMSLDVFGSNEDIEIEWESSAVEEINILYSIDKGQRWNIIATNYRADLNKYIWIGEKLSHENVILKIEQSQNSSFYVQSTAFQIWESAIIKLINIPELLILNSSVLIKNIYFDDFYITNIGNNQFKILSLTCTHLGCSLNKEGEQFECPCHNSQFSTAGCVKQGPALRNLDQYEYRFDTKENLLIIFRKKVKSIC
jgi:Rieske Fe-S protein